MMAVPAVFAGWPPPPVRKHGPLQFWAKVLRPDETDRGGGFRVEAGVDVLTKMLPPWPEATSMPVDIICTSEMPEAFSSDRRRLFIGLDPGSASVVFFLPPMDGLKSVVTQFIALRRCLAAMRLQLDRHGDGHAQFG